MPQEPNNAARTPATAPENQVRKPEKAIPVKKVLLIKPIKPIPEGKKKKLVGTALKPEPNGINADDDRAKVRKILAKKTMIGSLPPRRMKPSHVIEKDNKRLRGNSFRKMPVGQTRKNLSTGRALLKIMEHGSGPNINFAWPDNEGARDSLFALLRKCYGMQVALMDQNKRLFRRSDATGSPWLIDMDRISGFTRMAGGKLTRFERQIIKQTKQKHSHIRLITPVRMFPRNFDGGLLGELSRFMKGNNSKLRSISARYKQNGRSLFMEDIRINGQKVSGKIDLSPYSTCRSVRS